VLNVEANVEVDFTALEAMEALRGGKIGPELLFPTLPTAVQAYQDRTKDPPAGNQGP
jgi:hypothetical protein